MVNVGGFLRGLLFAASAALVSSAATAGIVDVAITSSFNGHYGPQFGVYTGIPANNTAPNFDYTVNTPGHLAHYQLVASSVVSPDGGFLFTSTENVQGSGDLNVDTKLVVTITNNTAAPVTLRFDSQITPGHLAVREDPAHPSETSGAAYTFGISLDGTSLYSSTALAEKNNISNADQNFEMLNGLAVYSSPDGNAFAADWGATNVNLDLGTFAVGQSKTLNYDSLLLANIGGECFDLATCNGASVTFGDPRRSGGVVGAALSSARPGSPLIGFQTNPFLSYIHVVDAATPLPPAPPPPVIPNYTPVPEPAAFALFGLGVLGVAATRRARRR